MVERTITASFKSVAMPITKDGSTLISSTGNRLRYAKDE